MNRYIIYFLNKIILKMEKKHNPKNDNYKDFITKNKKDSN